MSASATPDEQLSELLEGLEELPLEGGQRRKSDIDWNKLRTTLVKRSWFKIGTVCVELEADLAKRELTKADGSPRKVHYSQVLGFIQRTAKKGTAAVVKKSIADGEFKGVYYKFDKA